jgi:hypothetical protein
VVLSLENVLGLAYPKWLQAGPTSDTKSNDLGVSFLNVACESGPNAKTIFGGEHKNKYLLETTGCGVADVVVNTVNGYPHLLRCDSKLGNNWIKIRAIEPNQTAAASLRTSSSCW